MTVLVGAAVEHPYAVTVSVPVEAGSAFLADLSATLDRSGLVRGEHWSLDANVGQGTIALRFAFSSPDFADLLRTAAGQHGYRASEEPGEPEQIETEGHAAPGPAAEPRPDAARGLAHGRFLSFFTMRYTPVADNRPRPSESGER